MIDPHDYAQKVMELTAEFGKYVIDHPEVDEALPLESHIYYEVAGEPEFNRYSRHLAEQQLRNEGRPLVCVKIKGLEPPQHSRLIDPVIEAVPVEA